MKVLRGIKIVELSAIGPVPWCGMVLADLGADVVRIDRPGAPSLRTDRDPMRRGRRAAQLDLKSASGRDAFLRLVRCADVLIEGYRPGVMERLGLGPETCLESNHRLVYARMTGWGQRGPLAARAGHDINYIALTGVLHAIGGEQPMPPLNLVGDYGGGGTFLAMGLLGALLEAQRSGRGTVVDVAMVDGVACLMTQIYGRFADGKWVDRRASNSLDGGAPWYRTYRTKDGKHVAVGAVEDQFYAELLDKLGLKESLPTRDSPENWAEIANSLEQAFLKKERDEWEKHFEGSDACVTPVLSLSEAPLHPHAVERNLFHQWNDQITPARALRFGSNDAGVPSMSSEICEVDSVIDVWRSADRGNAHTTLPD